MVKILHIGLPKTGTTSLQHALRNDQKKIYFGQGQKEYVRAKRRLFLGSHINITERAEFWSDEDLSVGIYYNYAGKIIFVDRLELIRRALIAAKPDEIWITTRDPEELSKSWLKYHIRRGRISYKSAATFLDTQCGSQFLQRINLNGLISDIRKVNKSIKIETIEMSQIECAYKRACSTLGITPNPKLERLNANPNTFRAAEPLRFALPVIGLNLFNKIGNRLCREKSLNLDK